jgi:peptide deformylase
MVLPIYTYGTKVLKTRAKPVEKIDGEIVKLVVDMFDTMHEANGIGLAANQVGRLNRVIVVDISGVDDTREEPQFKSHPPIALINPEVVSSDSLLTMEEGCLSIPAVRDAVERPETITIRYKDMNFRDVELRAEGLLARVILHEIDHIDGILFLDHLSPQKRKEHREQLKRIQKGEFEVDYPVVTAVSKKVEAK